MYWSALQTIRQWTKQNHYAIHDMTAEKLATKVSDRFWNEHNFVFHKSDGLFYHGKGATPAFDNWTEDAIDLTIIPLNMAEPILIVRGSNAAHGLGFSPHGAGRNFSRTAHMRRLGGEFGADSRGAQQHRGCHGEGNIGPRRPLLLRHPRYFGTAERLQKRRRLATEHLFLHSHGEMILPVSGSRSIWESQIFQ
jgi:hypothetical protein